MGGGQHQRVLLAARRRRHHDDLGHARDLRRDGVHQHGRGIGRLAAGHVDARVQRRDLLPQQRAVVVAVAPAFPARPLLRLVVAAHAGGRGLQRRRCCAGRPSKAAGARRGCTAPPWTPPSCRSGWCTPARRRRRAGARRRGCPPPPARCRRPCPPTSAAVPPARRRSRCRWSRGAERSGNKTHGGALCRGLCGRHLPATVRANTSMRVPDGILFQLEGGLVHHQPELMSMIRSTSTRWLALSVLPVDTRSTMASARPVRGPAPWSHRA